jgi:enamine deaminase RidA (YjgF/YER057c/UK114 family)
MRDGIDGLSVGEFYFTKEMDGQGKSLEEQTEYVLQKMKELLEAQSLTFRNVVKVQLYLRDMMDYKYFNDRYASYMGEHLPPRSTVEVPGFLKEGIKVKLGVIACRREKIDVFRVPSVRSSPGPLYDGALIEPYLFTREMCGMGEDAREQTADGFLSMKTILNTKGLSLDDSALVFAYLTDIRDLPTFMDYYSGLFEKRLPPLTLTSVTGLPSLSSKVKVGGIASYNERISSLRIEGLKDSYPRMDDVSIVKNLAFTRELVGVGLDTDEQISNLTKGLGNLVKELGAEEKRIAKVRVHLTDVQVYDLLLDKLEEELGTLEFPISAVKVSALPHDSKVGIWALIHT